MMKKLAMCGFIGTNIKECVWIIRFVEIVVSIDQITERLQQLDGLEMVPAADVWLSLQQSENKPKKHVGILSINMQANRFNVYKPIH